MKTGSTNSLGNRVFAGWLLVILAAGVLWRAWYVDHPLDGRLLSAWRAADYAQIARNFYREGMNPTLPRVDWNADTPGYVEMEFPFLPWLGALCYRALGYNEVWLRMVSLAASVFSFAIFLAFAVKVLPRWSALFAGAVFAISPQLVPLATAIQPESVLVLFCLLAGIALWRYYEDPAPRNLFLAALATSAAILAKLPALHLGILFGFVVLSVYGWKCLRRPRIYLAAALTLAPPLAWYGWTHHFWLDYGNSLGVSNESHLIGLDMLFPPGFLLRNLRQEAATILSLSGVALLIAACFVTKKDARLRNFLLVWYGAVGVFYIIAGRTSGDGWAWYYHAMSVVPATLLMGLGAKAARERLRERLSIPWLRTALPASVSISVIALLSLSTVSRLWALHEKRPGLYSLNHVRENVLPFADRIGINDSIVVEGGRAFDEHGRPVAYNESMIFAWLDRRGFNYPKESRNLETLQSMAHRGARYWVAYPNQLTDPAFRDAVDSTFRVVAESHDGFRLYDLRTPGITAAR